MKSYSLWLAVFLAFTAAHADTNTKLKVGVIAHLSGSAQSIGTSYKAGFELALRELGDAWVDVLFEDDQFSNAKAVGAFKKLTEIDRVQVVFCISSNPCAAVAPLAEAAKIPLIAWASDSRIAKDRSFVIRNFPSGEREGEVISEAERAAGRRRVALITSENAYSQSFAEGVRSTFSVSEKILDEEIASSDVDLRPMVARVLAKKPETVGLCLNPGQNGEFAKKLQELRYEGAIFGCAYFSMPSEVEVAAGGLDTATYVFAKASPQFIETLGQVGEVSIPVCAANAFVAMESLHSAWRAGRMDTLVEFLLSLPKRDTAVGPMQVVRREGDTYFDFPVHVFRVKEE